jgi:hypothetical protein
MKQNAASSGSGVEQEGHNRVVEVTARIVDQVDNPGQRRDLTRVLEGSLGSGSRRRQPLLELRFQAALEPLAIERRVSRRKSRASATARSA